MTTEEKIDRLVDLSVPSGDSVKGLTGTVETLASTVVAHDHQIEALIKGAEKQAAQLASLERQWQAYINTLSRR